MDIDQIRNYFPITNKILKSNLPLIYMDHAASTHAPEPVLNAYMDIMETTYANVHRGEHELSCLSTEMIEEVPHKVASFIGVDDLDKSGSQVVLTTNTTSSLDLASHVFAQKKGIVLTTLLEHHSNDLPHRQRGEVKHVGLLDDGRLDMVDMENKLQENDVKLVAVSAGSNVTGYMPPVHKIAKLAHDHEAKILVDAAQRLAHYPLDVKSIDHPEHLDFVAGAGHKMYAPFGSAFLFGRVDDFNVAPPYVPGGGTVAFVTEDTAEYLEGPDRHQFGTPNIAGAIALGAAVDFLADIGMKTVRKHEVELIQQMLNGLQEIDKVEIYGDIPLDQKLGVVSFNIGDMKHNEVSNLLDKHGGIATRNGCFCAHPYLIKLLDVPDVEAEKIRTEIRAGKEITLPGAVRASIGIYNTETEVDKLITTVKSISEGKIKSEETLRVNNI